MDENDIRLYLMKKGYKEENIKEAISKIEEQEGKIMQMY